MTDDVEVETRDHLALLAEIGADEVLGTPAEMIPDAVREKPRRVIDRHAGAVRGDHVMDGADDVVRTEERVARPVGIRHPGNVIRLDAEPDFDLPAVIVLQPADLARVVQRAGRRADAVTVLGKLEMRREPDHVEALRERRADHLLGRVASIAPRRVHVVVRLHGCTYIIAQPRPTFNLPTVLEFTHFAVGYIESLTRVP